MAHHHHTPASDPAAIADRPPPTATTGLPADSAVGTALPAAGTGETSNTNPNSGDTIIPPSADLIPASPPPPSNNPTNNPLNRPNDNPNNQTNSSQNSQTNNIPNNDQNNGQTNQLNNSPNNGANNGASNNQAGNNTDPKQNNTDTAIPPPQPTTTTAPTAAADNSNKNNSIGNNPVNKNNTSSLPPTTTNTTKLATPPPPATNDTTTTTTQSPTSLDSLPHNDPASPIQSTPRQAQSHHPQQNAQNDSSTNTGSSLGTIMGILVAAVIGAIILAGVLAMIKRRKKAKDQSDYHPDLFNNEKPYHRDPDRQSQESAQGRLPMSPLKPRADGLYGPRPPSIIERHQASPAVPGPMPSYQPGQIYNYSNHPPPQHFNLHRPKPPTYHSPYGDQPSDMAYANHPPIDPAPNNGAGQINQNFHAHGMNHDQSQMSFPEQHGGINIMVPNPVPYPPTARGEQYPNYQPSNPPIMPNSNQAASYSQQQVDQLDFFGHPSPAATMIGSIPADWNSSKSYEKPFNTDPNFTGAGIATGIALTDDQVGSKVSPTLVSNLQQSYLDCHDRASQDIDYDKKILEGSVGAEKPHDPLQQSYLDCHDRGSQDVEVNKKEGFRGVAEGIEMDNLGNTSNANANTIGGATIGVGSALDWKLASPKLSSPLGDFLDDGMMGSDHPPIGHAPIDHDAGPDHILYNERPKHSLKVINH